MILFSIIVPTYNRKERLLRCVSSLLSQTLPKSKYEVIVVDDGSNDGTYEALVGEKQVEVYRLKKNLGRSKARNFGAMKAKGKYLVFTDSDCVAPKNWLEKLLEGYEAYPDVVGVGGGVSSKSKSVFAAYERRVFSSYIRSQRTYISEKRDEMPFALGNMSYVKSQFINVGGFDEKIPDYCSAEDGFLKEKFLKKKKRFLYVPVAIWHDHSYSLKDFFSQSLQRGAGMLFDSVRKGKLESRASALFKVLFFPLYLPISIKKYKLDLRLVTIDVLFFAFRNMGKLKYYSRIEKLKI